MQNYGNLCTNFLCFRRVGLLKALFIYFLLHQRTFYTALIVPVYPRLKCGAVEMMVF